jgi:AcrR family transcriptional regulator
MNELKEKISKRQAAERQERRDSILDAARKVFLEKGYLGATVRDIALEASLSPGLIYHYFDGKDGVYGAICEEGFRVLTGVFEKAVPKEGPVMERLASAARAYIRFYTEHTDYFEIISFKELGFKKVGLPADILESINRLSRRALEVVHDIVVEGLADGSISPVGDPWEMTMALWAPIEGLIFIHKRGYLDTFGLDVEALINQQLLVVMDGIRPR